jgi:hypothetical protein
VKRESGAGNEVTLRAMAATSGIDSSDLVHCFPAVYRRVLVTLVRLILRPFRLPTVAVRIRIRDDLRTSRFSVSSLTRPEIIFTIAPPSVG